MLALNVGAMLISFLALVALLNAMLGLVGLSLQQIFGWVFAPVAWSMGVPWRDAAAIGNLLGTRMALNEFVAFSQLGPMKSSLDPRSFTIATFALCGFANFSSIGIQIGGIGALAPDAASRSGPPRHSRDAGWDTCELRDRDHRGIPAVSALSYYDAVQGRRTALRARAIGTPDVGVVLGSGLGDFAARLRIRSRSPTARFRIGPRRRVIGHAGTLVVGTLAGRRVAALSAGCTSTRDTTSGPSRSRPGCWARSGSKCCS